MKLNKTREELIKMYIDSLKENVIPWRQRWTNNANRNGLTNKEYRGVNQLLLQFIAAKEHYEDTRWLTYVQVKEKGYKLKDSKGKGVPIEFWSVYDIKNKKRLDIAQYKKIIALNPEDKDNYKLFCNTSYVFNGSLIEGLPPVEVNKNMKNVEIPKFIKNTINNLGVKYSEHGNQAYYNPVTDEVVLPPREIFVDKYSYYATQLHELCHSTGNIKRLNRNMSNDNKKDYAREELIAEISSSFLMQKLNVDSKAEHFDNHKTYIKSWIEILEDKPNELFKAINESNKVVDYINNHCRNKEKGYER